MNTYFGIPRLADASFTMEQEKSLVTTGARNESETTALLVHVDAPLHTTQTATTATSAVEGDYDVIPSRQKPPNL